MKQKSRGNSTLASALLESLGNGKVMNDIAEAHVSSTRQLSVSPDGASANGSSDRCFVVSLTMLS